MIAHKHSPGSLNLLYTQGGIVPGLYLDRLSCNLGISFGISMVTDTLRRKKTWSLKSSFPQPGPQYKQACLDNSAKRPQSRVVRMQRITGLPCVAREATGITSNFQSILH